MLEKVELFVKTESKGSKQVAAYQPVQFPWRQRREEEEKWFASANASLGLLTIFLAMLALATIRTRTKGWRKGRRADIRSWLRPSPAQTWMPWDFPAAKSMSA